MTSSPAISETCLFCENVLKLGNPDNFGLDLLDAVLQAHQVLVHSLILAFEHLHSN